MTTRAVGSRRSFPGCALALLATLLAAGLPAAGAMRTTQPLTVTNLGSGAEGEARVVVRRVKSGLDGTLVVVERLAPSLGHGCRLGDLVSVVSAPG